MLEISKKSSKFPKSLSKITAKETRNQRIYESIFENGREIGHVPD